MPRHSTQPVAYSYIRFSTPEQAKGDSLRRQTEKAEAYCRRKGWTLDASLTLRDLGVSAFRGDNALVGNLGVFLAAVKRGTVFPGSALIVESVDRISRQGIDEGYDLIKSILKAGILLVTLSPEREFGPEAVRSLSKGALELMLILERAAEESERKSERVGAAWSRKKESAREGVIMSERLPAWVKRQGDKLVLIPSAAAAVRQIYSLAASGYGIPTIIKKLEGAGVPAIGRTGRWTRAYIAVILKDRRAVGELQPKKGKANDGEPIKDYYPAVVTEAEWLKARAGASQRRTFRGRVGQAQINIFSGLLKHARDGDSYTMTQRLSKCPGRPTKKYAVLINADSEQGKARAYSIPYGPFEEAVLSCLKEIDPHEILNGDRPPDRTSALRGELEGVEAELADATAFMDANGFSPTIGKRVKDLEAHKLELAAQLAEARQEAAHPLSETWGEAQTLMTAVNNSPDPRDARLRLRPALRRMVEMMQLLIVRHSQDVLAAVQIWFTGGKRHRSYLVHYQPASGRRKSTWRTWSLAEAVAADGLDLRKRKDAAALEKVLQGLDVSALEEAE